MTENISIEQNVEYHKELQIKIEKNSTETDFRQQKISKRRRDHDQVFTISRSVLYESGSFRSYSRSVRSFRPGSFRPDFRGESFRPNWGGSFRPSFKGGSCRPDLRGESFRPDIRGDIKKF